MPLITQKMMLMIKNSIYDQKYSEMSKKPQFINILSFGHPSCGQTEFFRNLFTIENLIPGSSTSNLNEVSTMLSAKTNQLASYSELRSFTLNDLEKRFNLNIHFLRNFGSSIDSSGDVDLPRRIVKESFNEYLNSEIIDLIKPGQDEQSRDPRIHLAVYFAEPSIYGLDALALQSLKKLDNCEKIIVVSKSDTLNDEEKKKVLDKIKSQLEKAKIHCCDLIRKSDQDSTLFAVSIRFHEKINAPSGTLDPTETFKKTTYSQDYIKLEKAFYDNIMPISYLKMTNHYEKFRIATVNKLYQDLDVKSPPSSLYSLLIQAVEKNKMLESQEEESKKDLAEMKTSNRNQIDILRASKLNEIKELNLAKKMLEERHQSKLAAEEASTEDLNKKKLTSWKRKK